MAEICLGSHIPASHGQRAPVHTGASGNRAQFRGRATGWAGSEQPSSVGSSGPRGPHSALGLPGQGKGVSGRTRAGTGTWAQATQLPFTDKTEENPRDLLTILNGVRGVGCEVRHRRSPG